MFLNKSLYFIVLTYFIKVLTSGSSNIQKTWSRVPDWVQILTHAGCGGGVAHNGTAPRGASCRWEWGCGRWETGGGHLEDRNRGRTEISDNNIRTWSSFWDAGEVFQSRTVRRSYFVLKSRTMIRETQTFTLAVKYSEGGVMMWGCLVATGHGLLGKSKTWILFYFFKFHYWNQTEAHWWVLILITETRWAKPGSDPDNRDQMSQTWTSRSCMTTQGTQSSVSQGSGWVHMDTPLSQSSCQRPVPGFPRGL